MSVKLRVKPLSVNEAWKGKRYKTDQYKAYEKELMYLLKYLDIPDGKIQITILWGVSNIGSDWDNPIKPFIDVLQKKYGFNDSRIYRGVVGKVKVPKGKEFIEFEIESYAEDM
ncbi:MAG: hypothetical protein ACW980_21750 [Promethearchaeota archaeon]|jgi:Holliday junction resolvase RusA-like endonuclease